MSVPKGKRKESQFEVLHHLTQMRKEVMTTVISDFGFDFEKAQKQIEYRFGNKPYEELTEKQQYTYNKLTDKMIGIDAWMVEEERNAIVAILRSIDREICLANSIYPKDAYELTQRRLHQERAAGYCVSLCRELQMVIDLFPVDVNRYMRLGDMINCQLSLISGWRKSDSNRFRQVVEVSSA